MAAATLVTRAAEAHMEATQAEAEVGMGRTRVAEVAEAGDLIPVEVVVDRQEAAVAGIGDRRRVACSPDCIYIRAVDFPAMTGRVKLIVVTTGGVTASTEVIAVKRHTGVHASVIACKNTIATPQMAYAA
jgi:hypothetical protein